MLCNGEVNPLTVHNLREMDFCPPHFTVVSFELRGQKKEVTDWIWENLTGRFWIGEVYEENNVTDKLSNLKNGTNTQILNVGITYAVAFEIPGEASMFALLLDKIQTNCPW